MEFVDDWMKLLLKVFSLPDKKKIGRRKYKKLHIEVFPPDSLSIYIVTYNIKIQKNKKQKKHLFRFLI